MDHNSTNKFVTIDGTEYPVFDLVSKYDERDMNQTLAYKEKNSLLNVHPSNGLKENEIIHIISGYNSDMIYRVKILGFDTDGNIYLFWDCWWFPVPTKRIVNL